MASVEPGGTERQMIELLRRLDRSKWDVHVACLRERGAWLDRVRSAAPCEMFPVQSFLKTSMLDRLREFANWCRRKRFAVVHTVDMPSNMFGLTGAALAGVPVRIGSRRDINPGRTRVELTIQRAAYGCAHLIVANAQAAAARLRFERVPASKITVVHNGLDVDQYRTRGVRGPLRRVVCVANLRPEKGHDVLLQAATGVVARFPDAHFDLVGGGPERVRCERLVRERGLTNHVTFHGHSDNVAAHLEQADIFVLPSRTEAFPNALLEAMAAGLPSVASAVGGIREIVADGRTGILSAVGDPAKLAWHLCTLMCDSKLGARIGAAARADVSSRFSYERMVAGFEHAYLSQLAMRGAYPEARAVLAAS
jgi:glycosyltransferase involved in cell wall biosynthesis